MKIALDYELLTWSDPDFGYFLEWQMLPEKDQLGKAFFLNFRTVRQL